MNKLRRFGVGLGVLALLMLLSIADSPNRCQAKGVTEAKASTIETTKIKLTWKTEGKISQIRIFRTLEKNPFDDWKKVATLKGKAKSYVDTVKYNRHYRYEVVAYQKKGKKYNRCDSDICAGFSGVAPVVWDEYALSDAMTTPESIHLDAYAGDYFAHEGFAPDGFEIFRGTDGKEFACIKTVKADKDRRWTLDYTDRTVQSHQTYYYKMRAFRTIHKKKYYGAFSSVGKYTAVNKEGIFSVEDLTEEGEAIPSLTVCLTSDEGNGDFVMDGRRADYKDAIYGWSNYAGCYVYLVQYSYDGEKWISAEEGDAVLKPGQSIYLQFAFAKSGNPLFSYWKTGNAMISNLDVRYNGCVYLLSIDLGQLTASAEPDLELIY